MQKIDLPIGVFDSGVGGLTVLHALQQILPSESFIYFGDTARLPYGTKSPHTVQRYANQVANKLIQHGIKLLVVACNTATALALPTLIATFPDLPILGVIEPGARLATELTCNQHIAVIATEATVAARGYHTAIQRLLPHAVISAASCSLFVALAEEGWVDGPIVTAVAERYLQPLLADPKNLPDCLILGCTHFPVLLPAIKKVVGDQITVINSAETAARSVLDLLEKKQLLRNSAPPAPLFWVTDSPQRFTHFARIFLGHEIDSKQVELIDF